jgi:transposase
VIRLIDRYDGLVSLRTQATCRLHVVLRELIAGGAPRRLSANRAAKLLRSVHPHWCGRHRTQTARRRSTGRRTTPRPADRRDAITHHDAVEDSKTSLLELHGVGPIVAAYILGHVGNPARFATRNGSLPTLAPSGRWHRGRFGSPLA